MRIGHINNLNTTQKLEAELILFACIVIIGSYILHIVEGLSYFDAIYFSIITLASIGYGDIVPYTIMGKIVVMFYALIGLPLFITMGYLLSSLLLAPIKQTKKKFINTPKIESQLYNHNKKSTQT
ncbi:Ion channel [candidate division SR1 bacterium Aalborg_AAW-1]|nr:Ion channel [candidate division SR1 bacterium Aalborg_AAW-1]